MKWFLAGSGLGPGDRIDAPKEGHKLPLDRDWREAELRAAMRRGDVYEVDPVGAILLDETPTGLVPHCEAARVVRVIKRCVDPRVAVKAIRAIRNAEARGRARAIVKAASTTLLVLLAVIGCKKVTDPAVRAAAPDTTVAQR